MIFTQVIIADRNLVTILAQDNAKVSRNLKELSGQVVVIADFIGLVFALINMLRQIKTFGCL